MKFSNVMKKVCAAVVAGVMAVAGVGVLPVDIDVEGIFAGYTLLDDVTIVEVGTSNTVDIDVDSISYEYNEQYKELHMFMNFNVSSTDYLDYPNSFYNTICVYRTKSYDGITYSAITDSFKSIGECPKGNKKFPQFGVGFLNKNSTNNFPYYCYEIGYIPPDENGNSNTSDEDFVCLKKLYITYDEISKHFSAEYHSNFYGGSGTQTDPYLIYNLNQLDKVRDNLSASYKLMADIDVGGEWTGIGNSKTEAFSGVFDGNGYTISGITEIPVLSHQSMGFFYYVVGGTVKNLTINIGDTKLSDGDDWSYTHSYGVMFGYVDGTVENCRVYGNLSASIVGQLRAGLLAGYANGNISECYAEGSVYGSSRGMTSSSASVGGLVGINYGNITNCYTNVSMSGYATSGAGYMTATFGGIAANSSGNAITNCYSIMSAKEPTTGYLRAYGIAGGAKWTGESDGKITNCYYATNSPMVTSNGAVLKTLSDLGYRSTFENWDFENIWCFNTSTGYMYPLLRTRTCGNSLDDVSASATYATTNVCYDQALSKAMLKYDDVDDIQYNVVTQYTKIAKSTKGDIGFSITCTPQMKPDEVSHYQLYQGENLIAESAVGSNVIKTSTNAISEGKELYIIAVAYDGSSTKTKLMIEVEKYGAIEDSEISIGGTNAFKMTLADDVPVIGGGTISLDALKFPVNVSVKEDGTVRVGFNISKDVLDDDDKFNDFNGEWKKLRKTIRSMNTYSKKFSQGLKAVKKHMHTPAQKTKLLSFGDSANFSFIGFGEGKMNADGTMTVNVEVCGSFEYSTSFSKTFWVTIPVLLEVDTSAQAALTGNIGFVTLDNEFDLNGDLELGINVSLSPYVGIGVKGIAGAGVTGNATLGVNFLILSSTETPGLDEATFESSIGIKVYVGFLKYTKNFAQKKWYLYSRESTTNYESTPIEDTLNLYDSTQYTLSDREYEAVFTETLPTYNAAASNTLISDIYLAAEPKIVNSGSDKVMVYLSTDDTRSAVNSTVLMYTVYDSETMTWSEPAQVDSNETMDWAPYLYELDGKIYVVYADANQTFSSDATIDDMAASLNIAAAEFVDGKFVAASVTSNEIYDSRPTVTVIDGVPTAVWVSNTDSDFFGQNSTNSVQYSTYENGVWSSPATAAENLNCVTSVSAGTMSGTGYIAVTTDGDNDLSTTGDSVLTVYDFGGTAAEIAEGTAENSVFGTIPSVEGDVLVWYEDGNLAYRTSAEAETAYVFESEAVTSDYTISGNKIMFVSTDSEGNSGIYTISYENGAWGSAVEAAEVTDSVTSYSATDDMVVFVDTHMEITDESITDTSALKYCLYNEKYDIEVHYADFDYEEITPGENLDIAIGITNGTQSTLTSVNVEIAKADGTKTTQTVECSLASGETGEVTAQFTVPATIDDTVYTVTVTGAATDTNAENNSTSFNLGLTELSVTARETVVNNNSYFIAEIKNESYIETSGTVTISDTDGTVLYTETLDSIPANDTTNVIVKADELFGEGETETSKVVIITVVSDKEEYYDSNNSVSEYAAIMDNKVPYVTVVFMDSEQNELSREVYDVGVTVTPPELPANAIGWVVYGDETETIVTDFSNLQKDVVYIAKAEEKLEVTAEAGKNSVTLNWNEISNADSYKVMSYTDGEFKDIAETTETTYTVEQLEAYKEYSFAVSFSSNGEWCECTEEDVVTIEVTEGLGFTAQPTDFTGKIGDTAKFTVEATGDNLTYQWYQNTGSGWTAINTSAARKSSLSVVISETRSNYQYRCVVSDGTNEITSDEVKMIIEKEELTITTQPVDFEGAIGDTATFTVEATGDNITYQWYQNTGSGWVAINTTAGKKASLSVGITAVRANYQYRCVVSDGTNEITSEAVKMIIEEELAITTQPTNYTGAIGDTATFKVVATGATSYQWYQNTGAGWTAINTSAGRKSSISIGITAVRAKYQYRCVVSNGTTEITSDAVKMIIEEEFEITTQPTDYTGAIGDTATFTVVASGDNLTYQWYQNTGAGWVAINTTAGKKDFLSVGITAVRAKYQYRCVVSDGTNEITSDSVKMIVESEEVAITTQPTDYTGAIGDTATFTVKATGAASYQWYQNTCAGWTAINTSAGRKSSISIGITAVRAKYQYRCVVSDGTNEIISDAVKMIIEEELAITTQPSNYTGVIGDTATFTVEATGATSYQWYQNTGAGWTAINTNAAKKPSFSVEITALRANYQYRCVVSDGTTSLTTNAVKMIVKKSLEITTQPSNYTGAIGDTAKFTVEATGDNLTYQWYQNTGSAWTVISTTAGRKASLSVGITAARAKYQYRCVISDGTTTVTSDPVKMIIEKEELTITTQPSNYTGKVGETATFKVVATGENLTYQWYQNTGSGWVAINTSAARNASLSVGITAVRANYQYRCVVSDGTTTLTSNEVQMIIS